MPSEPETVKAETRPSSTRFRVSHVDMILRILRERDSTGRNAERPRSAVAMGLGHNNGHSIHALYDHKLERKK